jgi:preprotein translocase YajC subunit
MSLHLASLLFQNGGIGLILKPGDKVVTSGGIYGTVTIVREDKRTVQLRIAENPSVKIDLARSAISGLQELPEEKK